MTTYSMIRKARIDDADDIVAVHLKSFRGFFLTFLGQKFLRLLYQSITVDSGGIGYIACDDQGTRGFVMGSAQPAGFYRRLLQKRWRQFAWAALPAFLKNPTILPRLLRAFARPNQDLPAPKCGALMSIAVDPAYQGRGLGKELVKVFLEEAANRGCTHINLTTDALGNESTNSFYMNLGFTLFRTYVTPEGRTMNEFSMKL